MKVSDATSAHAMRGVRLLMEAYVGGELPHWDVFASQARIIRLEPGQTLFSAGEPHPYVYYIERGLMKAQMGVDGGRRQATVFFSEEGEVMASMPSLAVPGIQRALSRGLHPRVPALQAAASGTSVHTVTALEPCVLMKGPFRVIEQLALQHIEWSQLVTALVVMYATTLQIDTAWFRGTPEQRYRDLLTEHPGLIDRVTQRDLANYLNITSVALSRIAKRVRSEEVSQTQPGRS